MDGCIFCKIVNKEISAEIVAESDLCLAILDAFPITTGHIFVMPKKHRENILESEVEILEDLIKLVKKIVGGLQVVLSPDGYTLGINHGWVGERGVPHLHFHIIPRREGDKGVSLQGSVPKSLITDKDIGQKLKDALKSLPD